MKSCGLSFSESTVNLPILKKYAISLKAYSTYSLTDWQFFTVKNYINSLKVIV